MALALGRSTDARRQDAFEGSVPPATDAAALLPGAVVADLTGLALGLSTAPARVEATYPGDPWVRWGIAGHVKSLTEQDAGAHPEQRLRFLERPEEEIDLAAGAGAEIFRMGVDWGRLASARPRAVMTTAKEAERSQSITKKAKKAWRRIAKGDAWGRMSISEGVRPDFSTDYRPDRDINDEVLERYREIAELAKARGMRVMLTLFHNSVPTWLAASGGWFDPRAPDYFHTFATYVARRLGDVVDYWVPFSDANLYALRSACEGIWPPGPSKLPRRHGAECFGTDRYTKVMAGVARAHRAFYEWAHSPESGLREPSVGVAHSVARHKATGVLRHLTKRRIHGVFQYGLIDEIKGHLDWLGLSYRGKWIDGAPSFGRDADGVLAEERSDTGETLCPSGLLKVLQHFHQRYILAEESGASFRTIMVTEAGVSDATDRLRPAHLVEHLVAAREAQRRGVPVGAFIYGSISDGWEWADGYCPKTGLVAVDRSNVDLARVPRRSYDLFQSIASAKAVTRQQRHVSWELLREAVAQELERPICGRSFRAGHRRERFVGNDWRTLEVPLSA